MTLSLYFTISGIFTNWLLLGWIGYRLLRLSEHASKRPGKPTSEISMLLGPLTLALGIIVAFLSSYLTDE